jgi:hypothetical protein
MVAEFKSLASAVIFYGVTAKAAICTRTSVRRAFFVGLWWLVTPNMSVRQPAHSPNPAPIEKQEPGG